MIDDFSNPLIAERNAKSYLGKNAKLLLSSRKDKKYTFINAIYTMLSLNLFNLMQI